MNEEKKVLVASDDSMVRGIAFINALKRRGIISVIVGSVKEVIDRIKEDNFDLVVTDVWLREGERSGLDLVKKIRDINKDVKIFVSTGYGSDYKDEAMAAGADGYFGKPYNMDELFYKPLGVKRHPLEMSVKKKVDEGCAECKAVTLRGVIHTIGNRHNRIIMFSSFLKDELEEFVGAENISQDKTADFLKKVSEFATHAIGELDDIEQAGKESVGLVRKVQKTLYHILNPDNIAIDDQEGEK